MTRAKIYDILSEIIKQILIVLGEFCLPDRSSWFYLTVFIVFYYIVAFLASFSETYISTLNEKKLEKDSEDDEKNADKFQKLLKKKQDILSSLSCVMIFIKTAYGFTVSVMLYRYLAYLFREMFDSSIGNWLCLTLSAFICILLSATVFYFVAVILPGRIGFKAAHKEYNTYSAYGIIALISKFSIIISSPFRGFSSLFFKDENIKDYITEDEILSLVDISEENGSIEAVEKEMIENVFDFSDIKACDIMTHRTSVIALDIEMTYDEILSVINENEYSRYPVYKEDIDSIVGILNAKKFYADYITNSRQGIDKLLYKPYLVPETIHADSLLEEMQKRKNHMAVVVDEYGGTCGIVTMEDLLERIVGNIYDETDDPASEQEIIDLGDGRWRIAGSADLHSLEDVLNVTVDTDDFDTLGGLVFSCLTVIPTDGTLPVVDAFGLHIEVESIKERAVEWAVVSIVSEETDEDDQED